MKSKVFESDGVEFRIDNVSGCVSVTFPSTESWIFTLFPAEMDALVKWWQDGKEDESEPKPSGTTISIDIDLAEVDWPEDNPWLTIDGNGKAYAYRSKPNFGVATWDSNDFAYSSIQIIPDASKHLYHRDDYQPKEEPEPEPTYTMAQIRDAFSATNLLVSTALADRVISKLEARAIRDTK